MPKLHFEDIEVGTIYELGHFTIEEDEMVAFAERYDPQPIHTDPDYARDSMYEGLIASGWFTGSKCMRQLADEFLIDAESMGSFGIEELRWSKPARPGDQIWVSTEILESEPSSTRPDRGYIKNELRGKNEAGETVISWRATNIFLRR